MFAFMLPLLVYFHKQRVAQQQYLAALQRAAQPPR